MSTLSQFFSSSAAGANRGSQLAMVTTTQNVAIPSNVTYVAYAVLGAGSPGFNTLTPGLSAPGGTCGWTVGGGSGGGFSYREGAINCASPFNACVIIGGNGANNIQPSTSITGLCNNTSGVTAICATSGFFTTCASGVACRGNVLQCMCAGQGFLGMINTRGGCSIAGCGEQACATPPATPPSVRDEVFSAGAGAGGIYGSGGDGGGVYINSLASPGTPVISIGGGGYGSGGGGGGFSTIPINCNLGGFGGAGLGSRGTHQTGGDGLAGKGAYWKTVPGYSDFSAAENGYITQYNFCGSLSQGKTFFAAAGGGAAYTCIALGGGGTVAGAGGGGAGPGWTPSTQYRTIGGAGFGGGAGVAVRSGCAGYGGGGAAAAAPGAPSEVSAGGASIAMIEWWQ